jgi:hypothetical protein
MVTADGLTHAFAKLAEVATREQVGPHKVEELLARATNAEAIGWAMVAYRKGEQVVEEVTHSYSGAEESAESKAQAARTRSLHDLAHQLEEAKYHANETATALDGMEGFAGLGDALRATIAQLDAIAREVRPARRADAARPPRAA